MGTDQASEAKSTRRNYLATGGAVAAGLLAGCVGGDAGAGDGGDAPADGSDGGSSDGESAADEEQSDDAPADESYTVSMASVGEVTFDAVPESWAANNGSWADMGIALGQQPPEAVYLASRYHTQLYDDIPGVSVDKAGMTSLWESELDVEEFLALSETVDFFAMDPNFLLGRTSNWEADDIDQIESAGAPFFANSIFSRGYEWHDYDYLTLYEAFEKLAEVFQEEERYQAFEALHQEFQAGVDEIVPPESERPSVAIMWPQPIDQPEAFSPYLIDEGTSFKQWRDLGVKDAFATTDVKDFHADRGQVDYELLLDIDPDVLLLRGNEAKTAEEFRDTVVAFMEDHSVASRLSAVENGDVYRGGPLYQGPITNLVLTERAAEQVYGVDEELFDRERVADIVNGEF
ncbi:Fe3+-hydroxamate ABC transporter substrate-binding protein [Halorubrum persicum]|uniref:Fe3+-hydroxamate ABC transporter substrate-binding protein n=1 Tax=Halorubrum persicum TaxID=1383844 RepID=A0A2G1WF11_9EURY|nr:ABC transporter substrate-binding protein [Halorubrum persicum]PHQ37574.1 Fe3+-hydroxamate ABC transporter substrate-binding protein [Halorubrum persicum]